VESLRFVSATRLARLIRERKISAREVVEAFIAHIERVNPTLNAVVATRFEEARREADHADQRVRGSGVDDLPPLLGVPCTIKEAFAVVGMPNASGLLSRKHLVSTFDATSVKRLRAAGAIPLGVTNTSELCMWMESDNRVYGRTNNPYDPTRIVGGSSGGEAAIISAAGSPFGLGSDIGGSIRGPCFFNGIFGHKATGGLVPNTGQFPIAENEARRFLATGPMAKKAEDLFPLLRILAGPDGEDTGCRSDLQLRDPASVELRGVTLLDVRGNGVMPVSDDLLEAQERAARALEKRGMKLRSASFRRLRHQFDIWAAMMTRAREDPFGSMLGQGRPIRPLLELAKAAVGRSDHMPISSLIALVDPLPGMVPGLTEKVIRAGQKLRDEMLSALGDDGVMLYPTYTSPAPKHGIPVWRTLMLELPFAHQGIFNVLEMPATQVPLGLNSAGLPLGCQVVSKHGNDHLTMAVAVELERALGGWVPPKLAEEPSGVIARAAS